MDGLDNPIWASLTSRHTRLALGDEVCRRYPAEIAPFAGVASSSARATGRLLELFGEGERAGILNVHPCSLDGWNVLKSFEIAQYVWDRPGGEAQPDPEAVPLTAEHLDRMLELTALVYPAYFRKGTAELGDYFGIVRNGRLCAMAGVRMAFDGHQEISAVCTHPDFRGQGLASRLSLHLVHHIQSQADVPFLHTEEDNVAARAVYGRIGFTLRAMLPFLVLERV